MAKIQVDFDQVMLFGDLHRDIASSLQAHSVVFVNTPGARLDQVIDAFGLARVSSNEHFRGQSLVWSLEDGRARADRVANSIHETSTRIFRQASPVDDHFDWPVLLARSIGAGLLAGPGAALLELVGGEIVGAVAGNAAVGALATPALVVVAPVFLFVTGGLALYDGVTQIVDAAGDAWEYLAGGLKLIAGITATAVAGAAVAAAITGVATIGAVITAPAVVAVLAVGAIAGTAALAIDNRAAIKQILGFDTTPTEQTGNLLNTSGGTIAILHPGQPTTIKQFDITPTNNQLTNTTLQHSPVVLQAAAPGQTPTTTFSHPINPQIPTPTPAAPAATPPTGPIPGQPGATSGQLAPSGRDWREVQRLYDERYVNEYGLSPYGAPGGADAYQCPSYVFFRLRELGWTGDQVGGGGGELAANLAARYGGSISEPPRLGAVVSRPGHVMLAEEVGIDESGRLFMRVSEMNTWGETRQGKGYADIAVPEEFSDVRVLTQQADGSWSDSVRTDVQWDLQIWNPNFSE